MSFSGEVKEELTKHISASRHCQIAELAAMIHFCGKCQETEGKLTLAFHTENQSVLRKYFTLLEKTFNIDISAQKDLEKQGRSHTYSFILEEEEQVYKVLQAVKLLSAENEILSFEQPVSTILIKNSCCQRAFLRGAFLTAGSMSDPEKSYHLELVCTNEMQAIQLRDIIQGFQVEAKIVLRKKYYVVYLKEGGGISDLLNIMEAHVSLMEFENQRIVKEMRNSINRRVNCEAANITKTVNASSKQIEDILLVRDNYGFHNLQDSLREMAEVRLDYPDATLKELGQYLNPPVGKSGVNHRLRKLSELADRIRT